MRLALAALVLAVPLTAAADDDVPVDDPVVEPAPEPAVDPAADPAAEPAIAPPSAAPVATPVAAQPEHAWCHGSWRWHHGPYRPARFALGFSKGHVELDDDADETRQKSLLARVVLHHGFELELEMAKLSIDGDDAHTGGLALLHTFGHRHVRPYLIAGAGGGRVEREGDNDGDGDHLHFAEAGGGLMLRGRHLSIGADIRHGVRRVDGESDTTARMTTSPTDDDHQRYVRGRITAMIYF